MGHAWYESSPHLYGLIGMAALVLAKGFIAVLSGGLLLAVSAIIPGLRWSNRRGK